MDQHDKEKEILQELKLKNQQYFPVLESTLNNSLIMTRCGKTLDTYYNDHDLSFKQINQIGIQLITILEQLHDSGYIYNDLKGDNICVGLHDEVNPG